MALRDNVARGMLLVFLREVYPEGMDGGSICGIFHAQIHPTLTTDCLEYMADKGYVEKRPIPHPYRKLETINMFRITAAGIDLCDGIVSDAGVVVAGE